MLTQTQLAELERALRTTPVLSVYLPTPGTDPAARHAWRTELARTVASVGDSLAAAPHEERRRFERAASHLAAHLATLPESPTGAGFVAFVGAAGVHHAAAVPVPVERLVAWSEGARVAPYVRALARDHPVAVALLDDRTARLYAFRDGRLEQVESLHAHAHGDRPAHMGGSRPGFGPNTRGRTGTEAAERALDAGTSRMIAELARRIVELAGDDAWVVCGGMPEPAESARAALPPGVAGRATVVRGLTMRSTAAEIARAAADGVAALEDARAAAILDELLESAGAGGTGAVRLPETLHALADGAVRELCFTPRFLATHPGEAEAAVRAALDQRAIVRELAGAAADRLDEAGDGVGARLRFHAAAPAEPRGDVAARG